MTAAACSVPAIRRYYRLKEDKQVTAIMNHLGVQFVANRVKRATTVSERNRLAKASLRLHRTGIGTVDILEMVQADHLARTVDLDDLFQFMRAAINVARELGHQNPNHLDDDKLQSLYVAIGSDPKFLATCVRAAETLIKLPVPLDIPGDTLATLDALKVQIYREAVMLNLS